MEGDPHQLVEGALIAAYATGASRVILYVHGEADLSAERLGRAVAQAEEAGLIGARVLGRDFACAVELRRGAGGFVLGEETALLESIEGRRAQPRTRPPFPVESGLWGKPTVINNVETLSAIPSIVGRGAAWFAGLGTPKSPGTKVFGLSGPIARPGVVEVKSGVTLQALIETIGGGLTGGRAGLGAVVGGPSGSIVPAALFDVVMEPRGRVSPGTGGIVAVPEGASVVEIVKTLLRFNAQESCGKCTPCREGTPRLLALIEADGARCCSRRAHRPRARAGRDDSARLALRPRPGGPAGPAPRARDLSRRHEGSLVIASPGAIAFELGPLDRALVRHPHGDIHRPRLLAGPSTGREGGASRRRHPARGAVGGHRGAHRGAPLRGRVQLGLLRPLSVEDPRRLGRRSRHARRHHRRLPHGRGAGHSLARPRLAEPRRRRARP